MFMSQMQTTFDCELYNLEMRILQRFYYLCNIII